MKRLTLFCLAVLAACSLFALPAHDARYLKVEISYQLNADGSWDMTYKHQVRLDTYYAFNRALGETFIVYNPDFQKLEVLKSETTMADGRKVVSPENAFNEVLPFAAHGFADFSHLREMVVTHVGLERGAVVELAYRIHTRAGFLPVFSGREILAKAFPVDSYQLTIIVPAGQALRYRIFGLKAEAEVSSTAVEKRFAFPLADLRPAAHEPLQPAWAEPFIVFSNAADWGQALAMVGNSSQLPAALVERVEKLQAQNPAWIDLLAELQKAVAVEVKNCGLGPEALGWQPRSLERVAQGNYGTRLEKALLLKAMLKKAGIESDLLAIAKGSAFAPDVPTPQQLGEFWLKVADGAGAAFLDPSHEQQEFLPTRCQGFAAFNLARDQMETLPASEWEQNGVDIYGTVTMEPAVVSGNITVTVRGIFNRYGDAVENSGKFIEGLLKKVFPVQKVEIKKLLLLSRHEFRAEVAFSGQWFKDIGAGFFSVDACRLPGLPDNMIQQNRRETPLLLEAPFKISLYLELQPAAGLSLDYSAPQVEVTNEVGYFSRSHCLQKNGHIRFSETCGILKTPVKAELYQRLRELFQAYFSPDFWLVFKKEK